MSEDQLIVNALWKGFEKCGFVIDNDKLAQFKTYAKELKDWNTHINLTSIDNDIDIIDKHFIDSLLVFRYYTIKDNAKVADIGTGAGFPGLAIKIYKPDISLLLLESIEKKARFLHHITKKLGLIDTEIVSERAEIKAHDYKYRECYDLVVARCVARLPTLAEYCLPYVSLNGYFIAYKGQEAETEITESMNALEKLGGRFERLEIDENYPNRRKLIFIKKVKKTPEQYPRRPGIPKKNPL